jgi:hypothetical protein
MAGGAVDFRSSKWGQFVQWPLDVKFGGNENKFYNCSIETHFFTAGAISKVVYRFVLFCLSTLFSLCTRVMPYLYLPFETA